MPLSRACLVPALALVATHAVAQPADPLRRHYERAQSFQLAGELDRAETEYRAEVLPRALRRLGNLRGAEGRLDESIELLAEAAAYAPSDTELRVDLAVAWLRKREFATAARLAEQATAAAPRNARARSALGRARLLLGDGPGAAEALRQALAEEPRFETAYALAVANLQMKRTEAARALFDQMLGSTRSADVLVLVGRAYLEARLVADAKPYFSEALEKEPGHARAAEYLRGARDDPPGTVLLEMLPVASAADASHRAQMGAQLEQVLASAWHNLAVIYTKRGRPDPAADAARRSALWDRPASRLSDVAPKAAAPDPEDSPAALQARGLALAKEGHFEEAEALLRRAVTLDPRISDAWLPLARLYARAGQLERARQVLARIPSETAGAAAPIWLQVHLGAGQLHEARALIASAAAHADADSAPLLLDLLTGRGLLDEAERFLKNVAPGIAARPELLVSEARLRVRQRDTSRAETLLRQAIATQPEFVPALHLLAGLASARKDHDVAAELLLRAKAAGADTPDVLRDLAHAAAHSGRVEEALEAARRLAALRPDDPDARYLLGVALLQNQEWDEAIATLVAPPSAAQADARWPAALGMAYFGKRDYAAARTAFEAALALDRVHVEARYHLGLIAREQGRTADAVAEWQGVLTLAPGHAAAHGDLGALYLLQGDVERARVTLERAVALDPDAPGPHYQLGLLYGRLGDMERARREMELFQKARAQRR